MATRSVTKRKPTSVKRSNKPPPRYGHRSQNRILQETFVYLMTNFPFFFLNKFGISDKTKNREKNVSETTPGEVRILTTFELPFGYEVEQFVHRLYRFQNVRFWTGSGRTEWFIVFSPIVGTSVLYLDYRYGLNLETTTVLISYFAPFVWLDGLFWLIFFRLIRLFFGLGVIFLMIYLLAHSK